MQLVEKADLKELGTSGAMKNPLVIRAIEGKLPVFMKDWLIFMVEPSNNVKLEHHFDALLKNQEEEG